jgi:hypothetical protein
MHHRIIDQLTYLGHVLLLTFVELILSDSISLTQFVFHVVSFATLSKSSSFITECCGLRIGEEL